MGDYKAVLNQVFGESSDSDGGEEEEDRSDASVDAARSQLALGRNRRWERIEEINGLWLCRNFLCPHQQLFLLSAIHDEGWFTEASHNQAMRFGDLPVWASELSNLVREVILSGDCVSECLALETCNGEKDACLFPSDLLWREPMFDQLIANVYQPGEGISAHVDLMRFEDGIAIVSLESSCVMHLTQVREVGENKDEENNALQVSKVPVYLTPGSLVLMSGEARYLWKHEINRKPGFQMWEGQEINQKRRISITLRKLRQVE